MSELIDNVVDVAKIKAQYDELSILNKKLESEIIGVAEIVKKTYSDTRSAKSIEDLQNKHKNRTISN